VARGYPKRGFARAKTPRTPSPEVNFFAAFAPLREIFRVLIAAPPRCDLCGDINALEYFLRQTYNSGCKKNSGA
jgi:hypothetical protein